MSDAARASILRRLEEGRTRAGIDPAMHSSPLRMAPGPRRSLEERVSLLRTRMEAVHTEFVETTEAGWPTELLSVLRREKLRNLLHAPELPEGKRIAEAWSQAGASQGLPGLIAYDKEVERFKDSLFHDIDAGFTTTLGAIADTGSLILWPTAQEPRLLSLVPPVHLALLRTTDATSIHDSLSDAFRELSWSGRMPTNALLVSGPSKTADIEQTLCYGVHGPKRLIVLLAR